MAVFLTITILSTGLRKKDIARLAATKLLNRLE